MAEFLVFAQGHHWMDDSPAAAATCQKSYDARMKVGDIVVVRPDGWSWGKRECLPDFLIVKVPGLTVDLKYELPLYSKAYAPGATAIVESIVIQEERRFQLVPDAVQGTIDELYAEREAKQADTVESVIEIDIDVFNDAISTKINEFDQDEFIDINKVL